jgi:hypothetical protein
MALWERLVVAWCWWLVDLVNVGGSRPKVGWCPWHCRRAAPPRRVSMHVGCSQVLGESLAQLSMSVSATTTPSSVIYLIGGIVVVLLSYLWRPSGWNPNFGFLDGWRRRSNVVFSLEASSWRPSIMFRWLKVGAVAFVLCELGWCVLSLEALWFSCMHAFHSLWPMWSLFSPRGFEVLG